MTKVFRAQEMTVKFGRWDLVLFDSASAAEPAGGQSAKYENRLEDKNLHVVR